MHHTRFKVSHLTDQISDALRASITEGSLAPGARLPTEQELTIEFGVSRTVVREAISRLKSEGLIATRQGSGAFVTASKLGVPFRIAPDSLQSVQGTREVLELRLAIESEAAALAAERASRTQLQTIQEAFEAVRAACERGEDAVEEDLRLHQAIAEATNNSKYVAFSEFLERYVRHQIELTGGEPARAGRMAQTEKEHQRIVDAIAAGDADTARIAAREHFRAGIDRLARVRAA